MKAMRYGLCLILSFTVLHSMEQMRAIARFCDTYPFTRTVITSVAASALSGNEVAETAFLLAWNANALYDLSSLLVKKYDPNVETAKIRLLGLTTSACAIMIPYITSLVLAQQKEEAHRRC